MDATCGVSIVAHDVARLIDGNSAGGNRARRAGHICELSIFKNESDWRSTTIRVLPDHGEVSYIVHVVAECVAAVWIINGGQHLSLHDVTMLSLVLTPAIPPIIPPLLLP